jgi:hypothetical protein
MAFSETFREGNIYRCHVSAQTLSTAGPADLWSFYASTNPVTRLELMSINLNFSSSAISNAPQGLGLTLWSGSTANGGGATITPVNLKGWSGAPTAGSSVTGPSSTLASTTSATIIHAESVNTAFSWTYPRFQDNTGLTRPVFASDQRGMLRIAAPQVALVMSDSLIFREIGGGAAA